MATMRAKPSFSPAAATTWIGLGWQFYDDALGFRVSFAGGLRGTQSELYYIGNGNSYAWISNYSNDATELVQGSVGRALITVGSLPGLAGNLSGRAPFAEPDADAVSRIPQIRAQRGVVHGASFEHGIVAGSWFSILGWNLAGNTRLWAEPDFQGSMLPTNLDGVEVKINGVAAAVYYISPTQINAQAPAITTPGTATLQVFRNGVPSEPEPIEIRRNAPEFFLYSLGGKTFVAALHTDGSVVADPTLAGGLRAARAGETVQIFGTGFSPAPAGTVVSSVTPITGVTVRIGNQPATVTFAGLVATGLFQVNVLIPAGVSGDLPVSLIVQDTPAVTTGLIPVR
jgi:uncharacterized protein (TIGR03437 family)